MAEHFPVVVAEINDLVARIAELVARLPPDQPFLHRAWWEFAMAVIGVGEKNSSDLEQTMLMRMVDYVQSVIASVKPKDTYADDVSQEDWSRLTEDVRSLFTRLTIEYQTCLTAYRRAQDPIPDMKLEEFRVQAETLWMNVRGKRYHPHERQALLDNLKPHSDVLVRLFGINAAGLVDELDKILATLTRGLQDAFVDMEQFQNDTFERLAKLAEETGVTDIDSLRDKVFEDPDLEARRRRDIWP